MSEGLVWGWGGGHVGSLVGRDGNLQKISGEVEHGQDFGHESPAFPPCPPSPLLTQSSSCLLSYGGTQSPLLFSQAQPPPSLSSLHCVSCSHPFVIMHLAGVPIFATGSCMSASFLPSQPYASAASFSPLCGLTFPLSPPP